MASSGPVVGLFLCAGFGTRFAHDSGGQNKLLALLPDGRTVIEAALNAFLPHVDEAIAVVNPTSSDVLSYLRRNAIRTIIAPDAASGMGHSLSAATREAHYRFPTLHAVVVALADMPWVTKETVRNVIDRMRGSEHPQLIVRPRVNGEQPGHPVGFGRGHLAALGALAGDTGARALLHANAFHTQWLETDDYGCVADVDRPTDISRTLSAARTDS